MSEFVLGSHYDELAETFDSSSVIRQRWRACKSSAIDKLDESAPAMPSASTRTWLAFHLAAAHESLRFFNLEGRSFWMCTKCGAVERAETVLNMIRRECAV